MKHRTKKLREKMQERNIDCILAMDWTHVYYLTGTPAHGWGRPTVALVPLDGDPAMILPRIEENHVGDTAWIKDLRTYTDVRPSSDSVMTLVRNFLVERRLTNGTIGIIEDDLPVYYHKRLTKEFRDARFVDATDTLDQLRIVKSDEEIKLLKEGAEIADFGFEAFLNTVKEGASELEMAAETEKAMSNEIARRLPAHYEAVPICALGVGSRSLNCAHADYTGKRLKKGDLIYVCTEANACSYYTHVHRMVVLGKPTDKQRRIFDVAIEAWDKGKEMVRPGVKYGDIDRATRRVIEDAGYGNYIIHGSGHAHGVCTTSGGGREELGELRIYNETPLQERHVMCVEPGIYVPDIGGVMQSDMFVITESGSELLTKCRSGMIVV